MTEGARYATGQLVPGTELRVVRYLGSGGMGAVYEVEETSVEAPFVMKIVHPQLLLTRGTRIAERMREEAKILAKLKHRNIVRVYRAGVTAENPPLPFYVMDRLSGYTVRQVIRWHRRKGMQVPLSWVFWIEAGLLSALDHAHKNGIVHRDVKPENLFVDQPEGQRPIVKLLDFGIMAAVSELSGSQRHAPGGFAGTYTHAAPEQLRGATPAPAMDIYAAGVVLFELVAGVHPFEDRKSTEALVRSHWEDAPPALSKWRQVHPDLQSLVADMLAKDPARRPASARNAIERLSRIKTDWMQDTNGTVETDPVEFAFDVDMGQRFATNLDDEGGPARARSSPNARPSGAVAPVGGTPLDLQAVENASQPSVPTRQGWGHTVHTKRLPLPATMAIAFIGGAAIVFGGVTAARKLLHWAPADGELSMTPAATDPSSAAAPDPRAASRDRSQATPPIETARATGEPAAPAQLPSASAPPARPIASASKPSGGWPVAGAKHRPSTGTLVRPPSAKDPAVVSDPPPAPPPSPNDLLHP